MKYERDIIVSDLYETSKSGKGGALLSSSAKDCQVYDLDALKDEFCKAYRHDEKLKSCDAYYYDQYNWVVVEFKNTHHYILKEYYHEIEIKAIDTFMILHETLCRSKKSTELGKKLSLMIVYNDALSCGRGVCQINNALGTMTPKSGDTARAAKPKEIFQDDTQFNKAVQGTKNKFEGCFYKEIVFIDKKKFEEGYIKIGYFGNLTQWQELV